MTKTINKSRLKRDIHPIPELVMQALNERKLFDAYNRRPAYQQNDYIGWILQAKLDTTRQKRLTQMLEELKRGDVYMKMVWKPKKSK